LAAFEYFSCLSYSRFDNICFFSSLVTSLFTLKLLAFIPEVNNGLSKSIVFEEGELAEVIDYG